MQCSEPETGCTPQPADVRLDRVENDPFSIRVSWSHTKCSEPDPQPAPGTWSCPLDEKCFNQQEDPTGFAIRFSTTREFSVDLTTLLPQIQSGGAKGVVRSFVVQVNRRVETWLLPDETFFQVRAVVEKVTSNRQVKTTIASLWSVSTEPWMLADSCGDDEFLNTTMMDPNRWYCEDCPHGGACRGPTVWKDVRPLAGFWRVPWSQEQFKRCPFVKDCSGMCTRSRAFVFCITLQSDIYLLFHFFHRLFFFLYKKQRRRPFEWKETKVWCEWYRKKCILFRWMYCWYQINFMFSV